MNYFSMFSGIAGFEKGIEQAYEKGICGQSNLYGHCADANVCVCHERASSGNGSENAVGNSPQSTTTIRRSNERRHGTVEQNGQSSVLLGHGEYSSRPNCIGFSEIDRNAIAIYRYHYPEHRNFGDATKIVCDELPDFDTLVGGFPCQAFSIAGKREGFADTRGTLFFEIARILEAKRPAHFLLENVKGLFSHDEGRTFKTIIGTLADIGYCVEWDCLNSKFYGVPQNRERVFIVGHRSYPKSAVFPIEKYEPIRNEKVYQLSADLSAHGRILLLQLQKAQKQELCAAEMQTLLGRLYEEVRRNASSAVTPNAAQLRPESEGDLQETSLFRTDSRGSDFSGRFRGVVQLPTERMLLLWNHDRADSEDFGQLQRQDLPADDRQDGLGEILRNGKSGSLLLAVQPYKGKLFYNLGDGRNWANIYQSEMERKTRPTLSSILEENPDDKYFLSETAMQRIIATGIENPSLNDDGTVTALDASYYKGVGKRGNKYRAMATSFSIIGKDGKRKNKEIASTLTGGGHSGGNHSDMDLIVMPDLRALNNERQGNRIYDGEGLAATVTSNTTGGCKLDRYQIENKIRRLTPLECERLQGFPDNWTKYGKDEKGKVIQMSDSARYKALGNAVTVNVISAIVRKMMVCCE